ncbi:type I pullulanase [Mucilaginibacter sp.]
MSILRSVLTGVTLVMALTSISSAQTTVKPEKYPVYNGELGVKYSPQKTTFKVWAPDASEVKLRLYAAGANGKAIQTIDLEKKHSGLWQAEIKHNLKNKYYTFQVQQDGKWSLEAPDIYAKAVGVNGHRGMVVDLKSTDPQGWSKDKSPKLKNTTDAVIYEAHIRDISIDPNSGIKHKGKFLGLAETGTKGPDGKSTGLDHIKELGVTHVHILPAFDFNSIDETKPDANQYNWGYDPLNYNVPEGSYSTNPYDGNVRIKEFKQMVQALHANGLRVILDVVYNHTADIDHSNYTQFAPGYFYRHNADGSYSNATGCGNEFASEQPMAHKFVIESVLYWVREYHVDGFRFDLMGTHDIKTMNALSDTLHAIDPSIVIYGEGWTAGSSPYPEDKRAMKKNVLELHKIAAFSDDIRDGIKGGFSDVKETGFVSGNPNSKMSVMFGVTASVQHPQIDYTKVADSKAPWAKEPYGTISYASCHDDNTLFDRLRISNPDASEADLIKMDKLANAIVLTSQGIAFLHSGSELLRTKQGIANSFKSPDNINEIDWSRKTKYADVFSYYKQMIALRKDHPAFRMTTAGEIRRHLKFVETGDPSTIVYQLTDNANGDKWKTILVILNGSKNAKTVIIPKGNWELVSDGNQTNEAGINAVNGSSVIVPGTTAYVLHD